MFKICSHLERQLLAVPTSRYSYAGMGFRDTCLPYLVFRHRKGYFLLGIGESRYCPISRAGVPPRIYRRTATGYLKHPFSTSNTVCGEGVGFISALNDGAFSSISCDCESADADPTLARQNNYEGRWNPMIGVPGAWHPQQSHPLQSVTLTRIHTVSVIGGTAHLKSSTLRIHRVRPEKNVNRFHSPKP
jgi:hypothetical protein